jgi:hypothetical protein
MEAKMYFNDADINDVENPLKYWCPNEATYDYVAAHDLIDFIKAGFFHCYVSQNNTIMDYNEEFLYWIREDFLNCLEVALVTVTPDDIPFWEEAIHEEVDGDIFDGVWLESKNSDDSCFVFWRFAGTEPSAYDEEVDVLRFDFCWDCEADNEIFWLGSDAVKPLEINEIERIIEEARKVNSKVREAV